ncbi:MAG TPA: glycoside hydrolase family 99-like domain-containing protein [Candidatus Acidoferrum sp.]|nr:glycoside hydrolase family 99-like domain-containing protein [Candidatus Acidoferrum sp.]
MSADLLTNFGPAAPRPQPAVRLIAFYLPQFHPIPENDRWWGKGFTEWTNVAKAQPLFKGHYQPRLPADLGYYDLRVPEVREAQAALARAYGVGAFCYWHYWFNGRRLLERPFREVLESGKPDFPFCLGWANETWSGCWSGGDEQRILVEQTYAGVQDFRSHFQALLPAFLDRRYVRVDGSPLFLVYRPLKIPDCRGMLTLWRTLAREAGLRGVHFVAHLDHCDREWDAEGAGFDAVTIWPLGQIARSRNWLASRRLKRTMSRRRLPWTGRLAKALWPGLDRVYDYGEVWPKLVCPAERNCRYYPMAVPNWDTTARYGPDAVILHNSTPDLFRLHFRKVLESCAQATGRERIVFLKSWNEWAEGNYLEPDLRFGHGYLEVIRGELYDSTVPEPAPGAGEAADSEPCAANAVAPQGTRAAEPGRFQSAGCRLS